MATHSSVLAWRIPEPGEPGELPSLGSHRIGHDWSDLAAWSSDGVHVLMCLFVIHMSSLLKRPFKHCPFFDWLLLLLSFRSSLYILNTGSLSHTFFAEFFQSSCGLSFHSLYIVFWKSSFKVWWSLINKFVALWVVLLVL